MSTDTVIPGPKWAFDAAVTECFDDMLARSIPQYDVMRRACFDVGCRFVVPGRAIVDLGCSRGQALVPFVAEFPRNLCVGVEVSAPMRAACERRFAGAIAAGRVQILDLDLRREFPMVEACLVLAVLTVQFTPIEYRLDIVQRVYDRLAPGGAFVLIEKVLGENAALNDLQVGVYYALKREHGYSQDAIDRKRLSLEGVLVPVTARWNQDLLHTAGFRSVDCFWRWMNFAGWVAVK